MAFTASDMRRSFALLNDELARVGVQGELYLVGGAVMCLAHAARPSTQDIDGVFRPAQVVRDAAARVAAQRKMPPDWLNDAVKGFLSTKGDFTPFLELTNLRVLLATPEYLLAMKCLAFRIGSEFHDEDDIRFLLRVLGLRDTDQAMTIVTRYYPIERFPQKTMYALAELLPKHL